MRTSCNFLSFCITYDLRLRITVVVHEYYTLLQCIWKRLTTPIPDLGFSGRRVNYFYLIIRRSKVEFWQLVSLLLWRR